MFFFFCGFEAQGIYFLELFFYLLLFEVKTHNAIRQNIAHDCVHVH